MHQLALVSLAITALVCHHIYHLHLDIVILAILPLAVHTSHPQPRLDPGASLLLSLDLWTAVTVTYLNNFTVLGRLLLGP